MPDKQPESGSWIGERVRTLRKMKNISQEALAIKAGMPLVSLAKIEQGKIKQPAFQVVWKIATALWMGLDEFVGEEVIKITVSK